MENPLRELRKKYHLSGEKMALVLGVYITSYYQIENGSRKLNQKVLNVLQEKFGINPEEFKKEFEEWKKQKAETLLKEVKNG